MTPRWRPVQHGGVHLAIEKFVAVAGVAVGVNVAGAQFVFHQELEVALLRDEAEINHYGQVADVAGLDRAVDGGPAFAAVMRALEAHDDFGVLLRHLRGRFGVHVFRVVLARGAHPAGDDVEQGQNARFGPIDDALT